MIDAEKHDKRECNSKAVCMLYEWNYSNHLLRVNKSGKIEFFICLFIVTNTIFIVVIPASKNMLLETECFDGRIPKRKRIAVKVKKVWISNYVTNTIDKVKCLQ